jgi:hypothetical protein
VGLSPIVTVSVFAFEPSLQRALAIEIAAQRLTSATSHSDVTIWIQDHATPQAIVGTRIDFADGIFFFIAARALFSASPLPYAAAASRCSRVQVEPGEIFQIPARGPSWT